MTHDDDRFLRGKAREAIEARTLPNRPPDQVWGGPGTGARCAICGASTTHAEVELEIEFADDGYPGPSSHFVHLRCFSLFELERQNAAAPRWASGGEPIDREGKRPNGS